MTTIPDDPYTEEDRLCDDDGMVAGGYVERLNRWRVVGGLEPYDGPAFPCTGDAHLVGEHIRCTSPAHALGLDDIVGDVGVTVTPDPPALPDWRWT